MIIEVARDPRELERALHHAERRVAVAIHDAVRKRPVICANAHGDSARLAQLDKRRKPLADPIQLRRVLFVGVFADLEFFRVGVVARIDAHFLHPFCRFHRCVGLEMDVGDDRHIAAALAQTFDDVLEIARILHRRRGDADDLAAGVRQLHRLLDRRLGVHRVAGDHRLDANRIVSADADVSNLHLARGAAMVLKRITAIAHENRNVRRLEQPRNRADVLWRLRVFPLAIVLRTGRAFCGQTANPARRRT